MKRFFDETNSWGGEGPEIRRLLDTAVEALEVASEQLALRAAIVRKDRAVGLVPGGLQGTSRFFPQTHSGQRCLAVKEWFFFSDCNSSITTTNGIWNSRY